MDGAPVMLGTSAEICVVRALVGLSAIQTDPVLIVGQVGTGKTLTGRLIHALSTRRSAPFERIRCDFPHELLVERQLFGVAWAHGCSPGLIERAAGGTLLLDDVGHLTSGLQGKLLRCLRAREFERVGDTAVRKFDVRLIATTRSSLPEKVKAGLFREDLYESMSAQLITLPSLNERRKDFDALVGHFLEHLGPSLGHPHVSITPGALAVIATKRFIGNLHDLACYLERLLVLATPGDLIIDEGMVARHEVRQRAAEAMKDACGDREHAAALFGTTVSRLEYWLRLE